MPGYWASDTPLGQLPVRIRLGDSTHFRDQQRCLAVSATLFGALQTSLALRQQTDDSASASNELYVSISAKHGRSGPVVARVIKDAVPDDLPVCTASKSVWSAIGGNYECADDEDQLIKATIEPVIPVALTEVVLGVSNEQYADAQALRAAIADQLRPFDDVLYPGSLINVDSKADDGTASSVNLQCLMCQPAAQGIVAKDSEPRVIIVKTSAQIHVDEDPGADEVDTEQWELGAEWFILEGTVLDSGREKLVDAAFNQPWISDIASEQPSATGSTGSWGGGSVELAAVALNAPPDDAKIVPELHPSEDPGNCGFMSLASLARAGIVSGSWVLIALTAGRSSSSKQQRAIRVFGWDRGAPRTDSLALPPMLLCNLCSGEDSMASLEVQVQVTPLGAPPATPSTAYIESASKLSTTTGCTHQPPLHIARKVVIARVSSPLSQRRDLESVSFAALREWLLPTSHAQGAVRPLRVVKSGDLISVRVPLADAAIRASVALVAGTDAANRVRDGDTAVDPDVIDVNPTHDLALDCQIVGETAAHGLISSELVFFKVVLAEGFRDRRRANILCAVPSLDGDEDSDTDDEYDDMENEDDDCVVDSDLSPVDKEWALWHRQTKHGGFIIEPDITNVAQAGAEHSFVPYRSVAEYIMPGNVGAAIPYADVSSQLLRLAKAALHPLALSRNLISAVLLKGNPGTGKRTLVRQIAEQLGVHLYELSCFDILSDTEEKTAQALQMYFQNAQRYTPCILHLRFVDALAQAANAPPGQDIPEDLPIARALKSCISNVSQAYRETGYPIIVVATSSQPDKVPTALAAVFRHEIELTVPDESTRRALLQCIARRGMALAADADLAYIAQQTASFVARDLAMLIKRAESRVWKRSHQRARDSLLSGMEITNEDLLGALGDARASMSDTLGVPKIPNVKWDDVGGLADAKKDILDTIRLPMEQPHLFASGLSTRSGLLFYGPPGTGKTLLAKAIATECGLNFFSCKGPELISPYIGESEANVRRIFQKAREASPCVIFFDELDSLAPKRGQQGDSGGVMDRIVSQLLAELDGMSGGGSGGNDDDGPQDAEGSSAAPNGVGSGASAVQVFAIGATNRPDLLDPALLRPGRFDKLVYLGVSETHEAQLNIIQALTRKFHLHSELDLRSVAEQCPFHYTGADFYALCSDALLKAMLRTVDEVDALVSAWNNGEDQHVPESQAHYPVPMTPQYYLDHIATDSVKQVTVTAGDFKRALDELIPSVSADELVRYQALRRQFDSTQKKQEKIALRDESDPSASNILAADVLENIQQTLHAQQEAVAEEIAVGDAIDQVTGTSTSKRSRKGKEPEI